jgi:ribosomal-protein-alanine N-acetyltransferase
MSAHPRQKSYRTKRLALRELRVGDWRAWARAQERSLPKQDEWDRAPAPASRRKQALFKRQLLAQRKRFKKDGIYLWALFIRETGEFAGWIDISTIARGEHQMANIGWFTINTYRGQGYAREAALKLVSAAFGDLGFHRLEAAIHPRNRASIKMARACGLHREGVKKFYLRENGIWRDHVVFITTPELFYEQNR